MPKFSTYAETFGTGGEGGGGTAGETVGGRLLVTAMLGCEYFLWGNRREKSVEKDAGLAQ